MMLLFVFYAVYRKSMQQDLEMLDHFWHFFLIYGLGFFWGTAALSGIASLTGSQHLLSAAYWIPHFFVFVALGYLWKVQSSIQFAEYNYIFWGYVGFGVLMTLVGLWEMPNVFISGNALDIAPNSLYFQLVPIAFLGVISIAAASFNSARMTRGDSRIKLILIGSGTLCILGPFLVSNIPNLSWYFEQLAEFIWIGMFLAAVYWEKIQQGLDKL
jgi:hypothetical protein